MVNIALGAGIGVLLFLLVQGYNVLPLVLLAGFVYMTWTVLVQKKVISGGEKGVLVGNSHGVAFEDIGGQNTGKKELQEALDFMVDSERLRKLGIRPIKGILLSGPPGTGKTLLAKAAAQYTDSAFLSMAGSEFVQMYAGVGAERVRGLFNKARLLAKKEKKKSSIIFIDELDILGAKRGGNVSHHEYDQTLNQLLVEMDGMGTEEGPQVLVIGATNRAEALDPALLRPGRFDRQVRVDLPDKEGRLAILKIHTVKKPLADDVDLEKLAQETFGFSGAHLESVANEAAVFAWRENQEKITQKHLSEAVEKVMMGEKLDRRPCREELKRVAVHEGGHALMAEILKPNSVSQVSIRPRGAALGYVRHYPQDDIYLYTQNMLEDQIMIALAGAGAEELIYADRSTGNAGDYDMALNLVEKMIQSGMSPLGIVDLEHLGEEKRQEGTHAILSGLEKRMQTILEERKNVLMMLAECLEQEENIEGDALRDLLRQEDATKRN